MDTNIPNKRSRKQIKNEAMRAQTKLDAKDFTFVSETDLILKIYMNYLSHT